MEVFRMLILLHGVKPFANFDPTTLLGMGPLFLVVALLFRRKAESNRFCQIYMLCCIITGILMILTGSIRLATCFLRYIGAGI